MIIHDKNGVKYSDRCCLLQHLDQSIPLFLGGLRAVCRISALVVVTVIVVGFGMAAVCSGSDWHQVVHRMHGFSFDHRPWSVWQGEPVQAVSSGGQFRRPVQAVSHCTNVGRVMLTIDSIGTNWADFLLVTDSSLRRRCD